MKTSNILSACFRTLYSGIVYDAMYFDLGLRNFILDVDIKPYYDLKEPLVGPAFTCRGQSVKFKGEINDTLRLTMLNDMKEGQVQVISSDKMDDPVAFYGDITAMLTLKNGGIGAVVDGYTRDLRLINDMGFPIFCRGSHPADAYGRWQIVDYNCLITIGQTVINSNDFIFGDKDGVLRIPRKRIIDVLEKAAIRQGDESTIRDELQTFKTAMEIYEEHGRW